MPIEQQNKWYDQENWPKEKQRTTGQNKRAEPSRDWKNYSTEQLHNCAQELENIVKRYGSIIRLNHCREPGSVVGSAPQQTAAGIIRFRTRPEETKEWKEWG